MDLAFMDEFELIDRLAGRLKEMGGSPISGVVGIGDDCAAIPHEGGLMLLTCDIAVEGRHWLSGRTPLEDVGWRVATANASDIAACGGSPAYALVSLGVPQGWDPVLLDSLYQGLAEGASQYGFQIIGGNVSTAQELIVDLFMVGTANRFVSRSGARPGDVVMVSGPLGDAAAGLEVLKELDPMKPMESLPPYGAALANGWLRPKARCDMAAALAKHATAAIDISDGLSSELNHLAKAGEIHLAVESARLPLSPALKAFAQHKQTSPLDWALHGGDGYQLLFTCPPDQQTLFAPLGAIPIGQVKSGTGVSLDGRELPPGGWNHLE
ncbi:MAG: thiamine-phosphate kinase [Deltaproteobacteria bacterium]|nr:thiamine-phosphate kinase [Deltaproteobacteria bacterium]